LGNIAASSIEKVRFCTNFVVEKLRKISLDPELEPVPEPEMEPEPKLFQVGT
jgi:hypothetical protein